MEDAFLNSVMDLYRENKWIEILKLNENSDNVYATKLLWVWPSENNLSFIANTLYEHNLDGITSLGCGCGLLEWIINKSSGYHVIGYEINREWWDSKYSNPQFIKLQYYQATIEENILKPNYALLFCYFNNGPAFLEYIHNYKGNVVFIIGPGKGKGRHTDPEPFTANFGNINWRLRSYQEIKDTKDFIAVYVKY